MGIASECLSFLEEKYINFNLKLSSSNRNYGLKNISKYYCVETSMQKPTHKKHELQ